LQTINLRNLDYESILIAISSE